MIHPKDLVYYIGATYVGLGGAAPSLLSLALIAPDGDWYYMEVADIQPELIAADSFASKMVLPRLKKVPGTRFLKRESVDGDVTRWLDARLSSGCQRVVLRYGDESSELAARHVAALVHGQVEHCSVSEKNFDAFVRHAGGAVRLNEHAMIRAMGNAVADKGRTSAVQFHEQSNRHLELLMGSKNSMSYRVWVRDFESLRFSEGQDPKKVDRLARRLADEIELAVAH